MHIYFYVRGIKQEVDLFIKYLEVQFWKWRRKNLKTKKEELHMVQGALRPSALGAWEYVIPKEGLAEFCAVTGIQKNESYGFGKFGLFIRHFVLRKAFGSKKIPKEILEQTKTMPKGIILKNSERCFSPLIRRGVALHLIGIKEDVMGEFKHPLEAPDGYFQEML
jgi:hypothetical protein